MKLRLQNYAVITGIENSYIKYKKNKYFTDYWILRKVVQRLSQQNIKISNHCHIQKLRQRKQWLVHILYVHDLSLYRSSFVY
jgi:hypothetical protein